MKRRKPQEEENVGRSREMAPEAEKEWRSKGKAGCSPGYDFLAKEDGAWVRAVVTWNIVLKQTPEDHRMG